MAMVAAAGTRGGGEPDFEVGFRFRPTEVELIDFYLRRRAQGDLTIPKSFIRELDIYKRQPWHLPCHLFPYCNAEEKEMYFFTRRRRASSNSSKRFSRTVDEGGMWDGHAAGKPIYKTGQAGDNKERIKIGHRAQLAFKLFDDPNDKKNRRSTPWILHEYRLVDDKADDVVLCRIHKRKGKGEGEEAALVINTQREVGAVAAAHVDDDDDLSFAQLLEEELMEAEVERRRVKRQRIAEDEEAAPVFNTQRKVGAVAAAADVDDDDDLSFAQLLEEELMEAEVEQSRVKRQRIGEEEEEAHQVSMDKQRLQSPMEKRRAKRQRIEQEEALDDDGLTMTLDEINTILDELPSDASRQQSVDSLGIEQLLECLEVEPLASFDDLSFRLDGDMLRETLSPAVEERSVKGGGRNHVSATQECLNPPLPAFAADEHCYDLRALGIPGDFVF